MNAGQHFLHELWGDTPPGLMQTWTLQDKRSEYHAHRRSVQHDGHRDVFTAVGTTARALSPKTRAHAKQICAIAGMWLDLDVKPGAFRDLEAAIAHAKAYLKPTILVDSGHGLHAYHLFGEPWIFRSLEDRAEAASLAQRWQYLHRRGGSITIDSTFDLARLMRLPGTVNAKDPDDPRPVYVIGEPGPGYAVDDVRDLLRNVKVPDAGTPGTGPVALTGDTGAFGAKLDALLANSPEFEAVWTGQRLFGSMSEADLSLCSMAASAMTDPELATLIQTHRSAHGDADAVAKGQRKDYLERTIRRARSTPQPQDRRAA